MAGAPPELDEIFVEYLAANGIKAFALAVDSSGAWACGSANQHFSENEAKRSAIAQCEKQRKKYRVGAPCEILAVGNLRVRDFAWPVQDPPQVSRSEQVPTAAPQPPGPKALSAQSPPSASSGPITYEQRWVEGTSFVIGSTADLQIWVAFTAGRDPQALIYFTNGSDRATTVFPTSITASSVKDSKSGPIEARLRVLGPEEYEKKIRTKQAWEAALFGAATALANQPQSQSTTYQGGVTVHPVNRPRNEWQGTYYGQITVWPTSADYAAASARSAAQIDAMGEQLKASYASMTRSLLRNHTMEPHSFYGGVVHLERFRGDRVDLAIPFGEAVFHVYFTLP